MNGTIRVSKLGKQYRRYLPNRPRTLQEAIARGLRGVRPADHFWALRDISFEIAPGRMVGLVGANGAGKSTLLRLVGGVGQPDEGSLEAEGKVGALLDLGAGFHPDLTGRENVYVNAIISGLQRKEVDQRFDAIVEFAELADFIDSPLRTYSTGMQMRLAFSIASHIEPDILLIDEALAVGDIAFQEKCLERINEFKANGCTILLVSHNPDLIATTCDEAIWLRAGRMVSYASAEIVADQYLGERKNETERRTPREWPVRHTPTGVELRINENRIGSMEMEIASVRMTNLAGETVEAINSGDPLCLEIDFECSKLIEPPLWGVVVTREDGRNVFEANSEGIELPFKLGHTRMHLEFERLDLAGDTYYFDIGAYRPDWSYAYDYHWHAYPLTVHAERATEGVLAPPFHWKP